MWKKQQNNGNLGQWNESAENGWAKNTPNTKVFPGSRNLAPDSCVVIVYRSRVLKSRSKLRAAIELRAALGIFLLHQNSSLFTVTFGEKVLTLAKSRGS